MTNNYEKEQAGEAGATFESGTTAITGQFCRLHTVSATVFSALSWYGLDGDALTGVTIPANFELKGNITGFTLTSGSVLAYKAVR